MAGSRHIQLIQTPVQVYTPYASLSLRFTVDAVNANLMPNEIFKVLQRPANPQNLTEGVQVIFIAICTPGDLENLQAGSPPVDDPTQPYRLAHIDLNFPNEVIAAEAWTSIQAGTLQLVNALNANDVLGPGNTVNVGQFP